ncbi:DddA-like double-stranded DNA deaminase toxin [Amycolatopsis sp. NPDC050768]|uniref:DddA-like double-stranded DNA deaminase toxin n=1 Tax=Amycolatopsis sp. NPDC050768 TaxID=3154839 RepID=UPI0033D566F4
MEQARERVGRAERLRSEASGEWVRSDGAAVPMASGKGDEFYGKVENFVRLNGLSRRVSRLATHVEIKVAVAMREQNLRNETVGAGRRHSRRLGLPAIRR